MAIRRDGIHTQQSCLRLYRHGIRVSSNLRMGHRVEYLTKRARARCNTISVAKAGPHDSLENSRLLSNTSPRDTDLGSQKPVKDFLKSVYLHVYGSKDFILRRTYPRELADPSLEIQFVVGVPATWRLLEQECFIQLVAEAGMPGAMRVAEPEAMAYQFLSGQKHLVVSLRPIVAITCHGSLSRSGWRHSASSRRRRRHCCR